MVQLIRDLWVITESGLVLFDRIFEEELCADLFGAFMSAIINFSSELSSKGGLSGFNLIDTRYTIYKSKSLLFVGNSASNVKEKKVISELKVIAEKFFNRFPEANDGYGGNVTVFNEFLKDIDESLEKPIDRLQKALW